MLELKNLQDEMGKYNKKNVWKKNTLVKKNLSKENLGFIKKRNSDKEKAQHLTNNEYDIENGQKMKNIVEIGQYEKNKTNNALRTNILNNQNEFLKSRHLTKYLNEKNRLNTNPKQEEDNLQISKQNYLSWDISTPTASKLKSQQFDQIPSNMLKSYLKPSEQNKYKALHLKDVPMNDLVKRLQEEFEAENDKTDIDHMWNRLKNINRDQRNGHNTYNEESNLLKSLIGNSVKILIDLHNR